MPIRHALMRAVSVLALAAATVVNPPVPAAGAQVAMQQPAMQQPAMQGNQPAQLADPDNLSSEEFQQRLRVQEQLPQYEAYVREEVPGFGGLYRDTDGVIWIATTSPSAAAAEHATAFAPVEADVRVVEVRWTLAELARTHLQIRSDLADLAAIGINIHTIGTNVRQNRIDIGVFTATLNDQVEIYQRYGPMVNVEVSDPPSPASCTGRDNCPDPLKGGLKVTVGGELCSSGFVAHEGSDIYLLSAGHCGSMWSTWLHNAVNIGTTQRRAYYDGSSADASAGLIAANQKSNLVFKGNTSSFFSVTSNANGGAVGDLVCLSARGLSSYDCGYIDDNYIDACYENRCFWDQTTVTSIDGMLGESGGAIFVLGSGSSVSAAGLMTAIAQSGAIVYYSKIDNVQWELDVYTCKNSSCS